MHQRVRQSRLLVILTALVTTMTLVMPVGMARAATATVTAVADQVLHRGSNTVTFDVENTGADAATYTPTVTGPSFVTVGTADPVSVAGGETEQVSVDVTVPTGMDPGNVALTAEVVSDGDTSTVTATLPVKLQAGENRTELIYPLTALNNPLGAPDEGIDKAFDRNTGTKYHSPWTGTRYPPPNNIDIDLGAEVELASLEYQPRTDGFNGTWENYEIWAGNDVGSLTQIASGSMAKTDAQKNVPLSGTASIVRVRVMSSYGGAGEENQYISAVEIRVRKVAADDAVAPLPGTLVGTYPNEATFPPANMLDHDTVTYFHTPYTATQTFPYNIDLALGEDPVNLESFVMVPAPGAGSGASNGRIGTYTLYGGNSAGAIDQQLETGTWANDSSAKTVDLSTITENYQFLRLAVGATYGDTGQANKFVSTAELKVYGTAVPVPTEYLEVALTRTDTLGATVNPGDELMFDISLTNITDVAFTAYPTASNLSGVLSTDTANCITAMAANAEETCAATYTVTEDDVDTDFTPSVTFNATSDAAGETVIQEDLVATGDAIAITATPITEFIEVAMARTDALGATVNPGDVLTFDITYRNLTDQTVTAFPRETNLAGVLADSTPNCRYEGLPSEPTVCDTATYTVTADDLTAGTFIPSVTFDATSDRAGTDVLQAGVVATLPAIIVEAATVEPRPEGEYVALASDGDYDFTCHRIPALTTAPNGDILAAWDGRPGTCGDAPQANSIIQRRSTDGGQTWGDVTTIAAGQPGAPKYGYSDPSYVTDREANKVFAFFLKSYDRGWGNSEVGVDPDDRNVLHAAVTESSDNGLTWTEPEVITAAITGDPATWSSRFAASGEGIQLQYAPYEGRLVQQYTVNVGGVYQAVSVYSDDNGATWEVGTPVGVRMDENKVVELSDGRLMINSRDNARSGYRKVTYSEDGGETYGPVTLDRTLIDPTNNASIIRAYPEAPMNSAKAKVLLFSNAASQSSRSNGTVRVSFDDGQTWSGSKVFEPGAMQYSTLTPLTEEGTYGLFYEGANTQMRYMTISMDWLGVLPLSITADQQVLHRGDNTVTFSVSNLDVDDATFTPTVAGPNGWTIGDVDPVTVTAGGDATFTVEVTVPNTVDPADYTLTASVEDSDKTATGIASVPVELEPGQNPSMPLAGIAPVNTPPAQPGQGIANAFDGDVSTLWHTPWGAVTELPVDVDIKLGDAPVQIANLEYVPRQDANNNGRINGYEIWAGDSLDDLTQIASGNFVDSATAKKVLLDGEYQYLRLRTVSSYGSEADAQYVSAAEIRVGQAVPDSEVLPLPVTIVGDIAPEESGYPASNMIDGDLDTWYHSKYSDTQTFPFNIDLALGEDDVDLESFVMVPHVGGGAGAANGRPGEYRILAGDSLDDLTEVAAGTWANDESAKTVDLSGVEGTAKFVRLEIGSTYGDTAPANPQNDKYVAINELQVFGEVVPPAPTYLGVSMTRTDDLGTPVQVGDELTFTITYTNTSDRTITAYPRASNLDNVLVDGGDNCRWGTLTAAAPVQECTFPTHTVTEADLTEGSFTPSVTFDATADRDGAEILQAGVVATLPAIEVGEVDTTPTAIPTVTVTAPEVTATSTNTVTATSTATATTTSMATVTATSTATATVTSSATATSTNTVTATSTATATATETATETVTATATETATAPAVTVTPTTSTPTVKPTQRPVNVYTDPGYHDFNGRQWFTKCEPYSATERCFTSIWASQVKEVNGKLQWVTGWVFNNLTYLPMDKETWKGNRLAYTNEWTSAEGRQWKTECGTPVTGSNGCRSYIWSSVYVPTSPGATTFRGVNKWVLNNMLSFN